MDAHMHTHATLLLWKEYIKVFALRDNEGNMQIQHSILSRKAFKMHMLHSPQIIIEDGS